MSSSSRQNRGLGIPLTVLPVIAKRRRRLKDDVVLGEELVVPVKGIVGRTVNNGL